MNETNSLEELQKTLSKYIKSTDYYIRNMEIELRRKEKTLKNAQEENKKLKKMLNKNKKELNDFQKEMNLKIYELETKIDTDLKNIETLTSLNYERYQKNLNQLENILSLLPENLDLELVETLRKKEEVLQNLQLKYEALKLYYQEEKLNNY